MRRRCRDCHKARRLARYEANLDAERAAMRAYGAANRQQETARGRAWRAANRERSNAHTRRYKARNPEVRRRDNLRRRVGRDELAAEYAEVIRADPCSYCGERGGTVEHVDPVVRGGANTWDNLTGSCRPCNSTKATKPLLLALLSMRPACFTGA